MPKLLLGLMGRRAAPFHPGIIRAPSMAGAPIVANYCNPLHMFCYRKTTSHACPLTCLQTTPSFYQNTATIITPNIRGGNVAIYIIDKVLLPSTVSDPH